MNGKRPSVFISYAHEDVDFVGQLRSALEIYMDVFWDRDLLAGEFPTQLNEEIERRDYLIFAMSRDANESEYCDYELRHAEDHGKTVVPVRIYSEEDSVHKELKEKYTYADFSNDFEAGFRRLCKLILGHPYSSWEAYSQKTDKELLDGLNLGRLPGIISKEIIAWIILEKFWPILDEYAKQANIHWIGRPQTPEGVFRQSADLIKQFARVLDARGVARAQEIRELVESKLEQFINIQEDKHTELGSLAYETMAEVRKLSTLNAASDLNAKQVAYIQSYLFEFDIAEKLRELINGHASRSRYLY